LERERKAVMERGKEGAGRREGERERERDDIGNITTLPIDYLILSILVK
jgi:hypothetical protein